MIGICETVPGIQGNKNGRSLLESVRYVIQKNSPAAVQHVKSLIEQEVSVNRNARTYGHLLGTQGQIIRTRAGTHLDKDIAVITKMNQVFAFIRIEGISFARGVTSSGSLREEPAKTQ